MQPLRYRRKVVGITHWEDALAALEERARKMGQENREKVKDPKTKSKPSVWYDYAYEPHPYQAHFGESWRKHLPKSFGLTSIKELIDHTIEERNRLFKGTAHEHAWKIYHDALPQWWEKGAQDYIRSRGFADRQCRASGLTNKLIAKR